VGLPALRRWPSRSTPTACICRRRGAVPVCLRNLSIQPSFASARVRAISATRSACQRSQSAFASRFSLGVSEPASGAVLGRGLLHHRAFAATQRRRSIGGGDPDRSSFGPIAGERPTVAE
jgi:hypothetical protein